MRGKMPRTTLVIQHQPARADTFMVSRVTPDYKASDPVRVSSPYSAKVEGRPDSNLMEELRWYLEDFLSYPFSPETDHADRVLKALKTWGEKAFETLFSNLSSGTLFHAATAEDYSQLAIQIASDDPAILSWPWEALRDPRLGVIAHSCQVERRLGKLLDPPPLSKDLPQDQINILLVVARPYGDQDVRYRSIARPLVELIEKHNLPAHVDLLRPPTLAQLREHLEKYKGHYHILHFDGHGAYGRRDNASGVGPVVERSRYAAPEGQLVFENEQGEPDLISAAQLNDLLRDYAVPTVVLNACQSGMLDLDSENAYASVAATLLRAGMRSVVAMSYSLYVSGALEFLPAFYRALFEKGNMAEAVRAGRRQMRAQNKRIGDRVELDDWILPVLYQQAPLDLSFAAQAEHKPHESHLPEESQREKNPYGFIGRDGPLLALERAMYRPPPSILIQGLGGVGKTTLARGFLQWLDSTNGLGKGAFWFDFREIRSAEYVFNHIGEAIFGGQFSAAPIDQKVSTLAKALLGDRFIIVWDNFESASGIEASSRMANLTKEDRGLLARFLDRLRTGKSKVIITSRSEEDWLGPQRRWRLVLTGLDGEERWEYCEVILRDLGLTVDRGDPELGKLMKSLAGHPLAMRVILPQLERFSASQVAEALRSNLASLKVKSDDPAQEQLFSALQFVEQALPDGLRPLLVPFSLYENYLDLGLVDQMTKEMPGDISLSEIDRLAQDLANAGLLRSFVGSIYEMHPALTGFLRSCLAQDGSLWVKPFVHVMARLADNFGEREIHEQRGVFHVHNTNFYSALGYADRLKLNPEAPALIQALAAWAANNRNFAEAERLYIRLAQYSIYAATAFHQLGMIAAEQHDLDVADEWYRKALAISDERPDVSTANTYHELGTTAQRRRDFDAAEEWYRKALDIYENLGDETHKASTYHQLGNTAYLRDDFENAEQWYRKSLAIEERLRGEHGALSDYYQLGMLARRQGNLVAAERWCLKALSGVQSIRDEFHMAMIYHELALVAQKGNLLETAEDRYRKALTIQEKLGNEHGMAVTSAQLGRLAELRGRLVEAERWFVRALQIFLSNDAHYAAATVENILRIYTQSSPLEKAQIEALWAGARLGPFPKSEAAQH